MSKKCLTEDIQIRFAVCRPHVEQKLYQCPQNSIELLFTRREAPTLYEQSLVADEIERQQFNMSSTFLQD